MSASPAVSDTQQIPGANPAPSDGVAEEPPAHRRRKVAVLLLLLLLFAALMGLAIWYLLFRQPIPVPTIPGEVVMPTYSTAIYGVERPTGVAVTASGDRIYATSTAGDQTARMFDAGGKEIAQLLPPTSTGDLHTPVYIALNPSNGDVYVSDRTTASIYVYDAEGKYLRAFRPPTEITSWQPLGLAFDAAGNLYVTDVGANPSIVRVFDPTGSQVRVIGADAGLSFPNGVAVDDAGVTYVTDSNNGRLLAFAQDGSILAKVGRGSAQGNLGLPRGVVVGSDGRVYVVDTSGQAVFVFSKYQEGTAQLDYLGTFGAEGVANGAFAYPIGIAADGRGRLYVADSLNNRVQVWNQ